MPEGLTFGEALAIVAVPATIAAAAGVWSAVLTRRNRAEVRDSAEQLSTGNGKSLGNTVHDNAQMLELLSAQLHTNTRELLMLAERQGALSELLSLHVAEAAEVHQRLGDALARLEKGEADG